MVLAGQPTNMQTLDYVHNFLLVKDKFFLMTNSKKTDTIHVKNTENMCIKSLYIDIYIYMKNFHLVKRESFVFLLLLTVNLYVKNFKLIVPRVNCLDIKKKSFLLTTSSLLPSLSLPPLPSYFPLSSLFRVLID